ncbi:MAG: hypothetical protein JXR49_19350 [Acidobacteria bacterium]|nr:hypothetical protein [Acidobacteriota bacterium]
MPEAITRTVSHACYRRGNALNEGKRAYERQFNGCRASRLESRKREEIYKAQAKERQREHGNTAPGREKETLHQISDDPKNHAGWTAPDEK